MLKDIKLQHLANILMLKVLVHRLLEQKHTLKATLQSLAEISRTLKDISQKPVKISHPATVKEPTRKATRLMPMVMVLTQKVARQKLMAMAPMLKDISQKQLMMELMPKADHKLVL